MSPQNTMNTSCYSRCHHHGQCQGRPLIISKFLSKFTCIVLLIMSFSMTCNSAIIVHTQSPEYLSVVNIFGRIAEHKALGFTSSYDEYQPIRLSLWIPNRWSRRLRVNNPDWKGLFAGDAAVDRATFETRLRALPFMYPADCEVPNELKRTLQLDLQLENLDGLTGERLLREEPSLLEAVEARLQATEISARALDAVFFLFGGREGELLLADIMESRILEWGMLTCRDDPVIDFEAFELKCCAFISPTRPATAAAFSARE